MTEFEHDGSALAAVRAFLDLHDDRSSDEEEPPEKYIPRPARLGVGANPNQAVHGTSTPGLDEANRRLGNALRRQAQAAENSDRGSYQSSDDDDVVSRAQAMAKGFEKKHCTSAKQTSEKRARSGVQDLHSERCVAVNNKEVAECDSDDEWGDDVLRRMSEEQGADFERWSKGFVLTQDASALKGEKRYAAEYAIKRKKKKKRSRQKNLRRDKRKRHELPAHLTEETLKAGRVRRSDNGKAEFHASRFEDSRQTRRD